MRKNTIIRFPEQMTMERALNHNMDWTVRQLRTLTRRSNRLSNGLLSAGVGLACLLLLWGLTEKEVSAVQSQNRTLTRELNDTKDELEVLKIQMTAIEVAEEGRTQM